ncbi:MAG: DinB family protein [Anaerolineae bacterium]
MVHPLVQQLRFARSEFRRAMEGVSDEDARHRFMPMNSLSWMIMHLAAQEQFFWLIQAQGRTLNPRVYELAGYGQPASTPPLDEAWAAWEAITEAADPCLDTFTSAMLTSNMCTDCEGEGESIGTMLLRLTYHYWYHIGETQAIRQMLGHQRLPEFVGAIHSEAPYTPEA